jgi:hypothetical protein
MDTESLVYVQTQLVRGLGGTVHERYRIKNRWVTDERCNLDQTKLAVLGDRQVSDIERASLCGHCFTDLEE